MFKRKTIKKEKWQVEGQPDSEITIEGPIGDLLEAVINADHVRASAEQDPFEIYQYQLHSHLHENISQFKERFLKGYISLIDQMKDNS